MCVGFQDLKDFGIYEYDGSEIDADAATEIASNVTNYELKELECVSFGMCCDMRGSIGAPDYAIMSCVCKSNCVRHSPIFSIITGINLAF